LLDPRPSLGRGGKHMFAFEMVGMALFALFFGALITNKQSISR
jgi:hypothetical protein